MKIKPNFVGGSPAFFGDGVSFFSSGGSLIFPNRVDFTLCPPRSHCRGVSRTPHHPYYLPKAQISKHLSVLSLVRVRGSKSLLLTPPSSKGGGECGRPLCSDLSI